MGYKVIEKFSPNMMKLLAAMASFSRMVSAMAPVTPLRPRDFKLSQISSLAYLNGVLHQFLVSTAERFRLKMYILGRSFDVGSRFLLQSTQRIVRERARGQREWEQVKAIRDDFQTLTDESLEGLRQLLTSLAAERKDADLDRFDTVGLLRPFSALSVGSSAWRRTERESRHFVDDEAESPCTFSVRPLPLIAFRR